MRTAASSSSRSERNTPVELKPLSATEFVLSDSNSANTFRFTLDDAGHGASDGSLRLSPRSSTGAPARPFITSFTTTGALRS